MNFNDFISVAEVASFHGVDRKTVYKWMERGIAPRHEMICGHPFFYRADAEAFVKPTRGRKYAG